MPIRHAALAIAALAASSVAASAADLPMHTKAPPLVAEAVYSGTGFYIGGKPDTIGNPANSFSASKPTSRHRISMAPRC